MPRSTHQRAAVRSSATKSRSNGFTGSRQRSLLRVLKRIRLGSAATPLRSSHAAPMWPGPSNSMTRHGPTNASMGSWSMVDAPSMKWIGGSTCVPVWLPNVTTDTLAESPFAMRRSGVIFGPSSPGQVGIPVRITSETSCTFIRLPPPRPEHMARPEAILSRDGHTARGRERVHRSGCIPRGPLRPRVGKTLARLSREVPGAAVAGTYGGSLRGYRRVGALAHAADRGWTYDGRHHPRA